jgi:hypothetical protein
VPEKSQFENEIEQKQWEDNCRQLLKLFDENKIIYAELHRNLGEFDECIKILDDTDAENYIIVPMNVPCTSN